MKHVQYLPSQLFGGALFKPRNVDATASGHSKANQNRLCRRLRKARFRTVQIFEMGKHGSKRENKRRKTMEKPWNINDVLLNSEPFGAIDNIDSLQLAWKADYHFTVRNSWHDISDFRKVRFAPSDCLQQLHHSPLRLLQLTGEDGRSETRKAL